MQEIMNLKIKFRESFRPFAPTVLKDKASDFFDIDRDSPYMLLVAPVKREIMKEMTEDEKRYFGLEKLHIVRSTFHFFNFIDFTRFINAYFVKTFPQGMDDHCFHYELVHDKDFIEDFFLFDHNAYWNFGKNIRERFFRIKI